MKELRYFVGDESCNDDDNQLPFIALRANPDSKNNLKIYSNTYAQNDSEEGTNKWYIVLEFRSDDELESTIKECKERSRLFIPFFDEESKVYPEETCKFISVLREDDLRSVNIRTRKMRRLKRKGTRDDSS